MITLNSNEMKVYGVKSAKKAQVFNTKNKI